MPDEPNSAVLRAVAPVAVLAAAAVACTNTAAGSAFCEQAEFFASRSVRDIDPAADRSSAAYLDALTSLRDLAPTDLRDDLGVLVDYEQSYDPDTAPERVPDDYARAGERVARAIEDRCDLQLPGIR
jgi:hypothetical protein